MHDEEPHLLRSWCSKVGYASKKDCNTVKNAILNGHNRKRKKPKNLRAYACAACGMWHLTSQV